jgi:uncharacterized membrane protein YoaK (UPF0700 family)
MFQHRLDEIRSGGAKITIFQWFLMSFLSGNVNAGGYLACARFVTHVTGFATLFGIDAANRRWDAAIGILSVPSFFLGGAVLSAYLVDRPARRGREPRYEIVMALVALCLALAASLVHLSFFGPFGEVVRLKRDYFLLALLCLASGLQNAAISSSSGGTVRATHLTGITTDLGIGLVRAVSGPATQARDEWVANRFRVGTIASFIAGSVAGAYLFLRVQYLGFLVPAGIALYAMAVAAISPDRRPSASAR